MTRGVRSRRHRNHFHRRTPPGASPGTLAIDPQASRPKIRVTAYNEESEIEEMADNIESVRNHVGKWPVVWIEVEGLGDEKIIRQLGQLFTIHRLALEDVVNVHQRAKAELYDDDYFIVMRTVEMQDRLETRQLSLFLGRNYVLTFQETASYCFDPIRTRIREKGGRIRSSGADYLAYALMDAAIDNYYPILEKYGEEIEALEDQVVIRPDRQFVTKIHEMKRDLLLLRRAVWPLREAINSLIREPAEIVTETTRVYLRDCYDHTIQLIDLMENYRDIAASLMDVYLSSVSNRLNEIMKVLTIFTAFFIPLNLIVGIYGMNFNTEKSPWNMPELNWHYGYPFVFCLMAGAALATFLYFRRKGWVGSSKDPEASGPNSE
jgi:magnesium transporter